MYIHYVNKLFITQIRIKQIEPRSQNYRKTLVDRENAKIKSWV